MGSKREASLNMKMTRKVSKWLEKLPMKMKILAVMMAAIFALVAIGYFALSPQKIYIAYETSHAVGIFALIFKLAQKKSCSGLSLRSQELTAIFIVVKLYSGMDYEGLSVHSALDVVTLAATGWVIYMMRYKLNSSYSRELDNMPRYYTIVPCAILAMVIHPGMTFDITNIPYMLWAFCVYLESVSVLPQLRVMQNAKMVEPFTAQYVFALGVSRFFAFANWTIEVYKSRGSFFFMIPSGYLWVPVASLAELVQTFILADFCYYYAKSVIYNRRLVAMSVPV